MNEIMSKAEIRSMVAEEFLAAMTTIVKRSMPRYRACVAAGLMTVDEAWNELMMIVDAYLSIFMRVFNESKN